MLAYFRRRADDSSVEFVSGTQKQIPNEMKARLQAVGRFCRGYDYYGASQFTNPEACGVAFEIGEDGRTMNPRPRQQTYPDLVHEMYLASCEPENSRYQQFMDIVGLRGLRLIDSLVFKKVLASSRHIVRVGGDIKKRRNKRYLVVPTVTIRETTLSPNQHF